MNHSASPGALLEDAIRQIVREEVRAALADAERGRSGTPASVKQHAGSGAQILSVEDVASKTGLAVQTLNNWRTATKPGRVAGPPFFKLGRLVRYAEADVDAWIAGHSGAPGDRPEGALRT